MQQRARSVVLAAALAAGLSTAAAAQDTLKVGAAAPDFSLVGATRAGVLGAPIHLSDFQGQTVVLAFFYKARTKGWTIQMNAYRDQYATLFHNGKKVVLLAISTDSAAVLASWAKDADYPFTFLSDPGGTVGKLYGSYNTTYGLDGRNLFVVAPDGTLGYTAVPFREVDPTAYTALGAAIDRLAGPP